MHRRLVLASAILLALPVTSGCQREDPSPQLAGGREVKWWLAALKDPKPQSRLQAVLKLGNVGDADPAAAEGLAQALSDRDAGVRRQAVLAISKLSKPNETIRTQLETMSRGDRDRRVRETSQRVLERLDRRG